MKFLQYGQFSQTVSLKKVVKVSFDLFEGQVGKVWSLSQFVNVAQKRKSLQRADLILGLGLRGPIHFHSADGNLGRLAEKNPLFSSLSRSQFQYHFTDRKLFSELSSGLSSAKKLTGDYSQDQQVCLL